MDANYKFSNQNYPLIFLGFINNKLFLPLSLSIVSRGNEAAYIDAIINNDQFYFKIHKKNRG